MSGDSIGFPLSERLMDIVCLVYEDSRARLIRDSYTQGQMAKFLKPF